MNFCGCGKEVTSARVQKAGGGKRETGGWTPEEVRGMHVECDTQTHQRPCQRQSTESEKVQTGKTKIWGQKKKNVRAHRWARVTSVSRLAEEQPQQYPLVLQMVKLPITYDSTWYKSKGQVCFRGGQDKEKLYRIKHKSTKH